MVYETRRRNNNAPRLSLSINFAIRPLDSSLSLSLYIPQAWAHFVRSTWLGREREREWHGQSRLVPLPSSVWTRKTLSRHEMAYIECYCCWKRRENIIIHSMRRRKCSRTKSERNGSASLSSDFLPVSQCLWLSLSSLFLRGRKKKGIIIIIKKEGSHTRDSERRRRRRKERSNLTHQGRENESESHTKQTRSQRVKEKDTQ